jgi:hypothetical protein
LGRPLLSKKRLIVNPQKFQGGLNRTRDSLDEGKAADEP